MDGIPQRKMMGTGGSPMSARETFGVDPLEEVNGGMRHPDRGMKHEPMRDGDRGVGKHVPMGRGNMPTQRHPDHGPQHHRPEPDFGTGDLPR